MVFTLAASAMLSLFHAESASQAGLQSHEVRSDASCFNELPDIERIAQTHLLTESNWQMFRRIAMFRSAKGLEVLPGMVGCPTLSGAASELDLDAGTSAMLKQEGYGSRDYVGVGWAVLIAADPNTFRVQPSGTVSANRCFLVHRRAEARNLLYPKGP